MLCRKTHRMEKSKIGKKHWRLGFGEKVGTGTRMDLEEWLKLPRRSRKTLQGVQTKRELMKEMKYCYKCGRSTIHDGKNCLRCKSIIGR